MSRDPVILLAEDKEDDVILVKKAFQKGGVRNEVFVVKSGEEAIHYLAGTGRFGMRDSYPLPALILLDLSMPGTDGFEVLRWIKSQPDLAAIRVLVLTASDRIHDMNTAYKLGADSFLVKSIDFEDAVQMAKAVGDFWLRTNRLPPSSAAPIPPSSPAV